MVTGKQGDPPRIARPQSQAPTYANWGKVLRGQQGAAWMPLWCGFAGELHGGTAYSQLFTPPH